MQDKTITLNVSANGRKGGRACADALTDQQRKARAKKAATAKWLKFYRDNPGKRKRARRKK